MSIQKTALFDDRLPRADVDIDGVGTITVRALSRFEAALIAKREGNDAREKLILHLGMVDPVMSEADVGSWMRVATPQEIEKVTTAIATISGLLEDAPKSAYKSDGDGSGPGV